MKHCYLIFNRCDNHDVNAPIFLLLLHYAIDGTFCFVEFYFIFLRKGKIACPFERNIYVYVAWKNRQWKFGWFNFLTVIYIRLFLYFFFFSRSRLLVDSSHFWKLFCRKRKLVFCWEKVWLTNFAEFFHGAISCWFSRRCLFVRSTIFSSNFQTLLRKRIL